MQEINKMNVGFTTVVALASATVGLGVSWGSYSSRLKDAEDRSRETQRTTQRLEVSLATVQGQYGEILRRLDRIENIARLQR